MALRAYTIPSSLKAEIDELESLISGFQKGSITEAELKAHRVPFGVYEQRKRGTYMVRIRCTAGIITPLQLKRVAELSLRFASGSLHITTRQEIQIHDVAIDDLGAIIRELADAGLSTRGGGGNTVRNVTAPWDSGVAPGEIFDVAPYSVALTSALIARADSWILPRKYKIAFATSEKDNAFATVNDLGFIAQINNGVPGFRVYVAGGMGRQSQPGHLLHEFVGTSEIFLSRKQSSGFFPDMAIAETNMPPGSVSCGTCWVVTGSLLFTMRKRPFCKTRTLEHLKATAIPNDITIPSGIEPVNAPSDEFSRWRKRYVSASKTAWSPYNPHSLSPWNYQRGKGPPACRFSDAFR